MFNVSDIPLKLRDNTLHIGVEWYAFCILLRISIGLGMIIYNSTTNKLNIYITVWQEISSA